MDNNNYIICHRCGQYVVSGSAFCNRCGFQFQSQPVYQQQDAKRKDSPLSIISAIISLVGVFSLMALSILGFIVAVIDLAVSQASNNETQKHSCSWFSVVVFIIYILIVTLT